MSDVSGNSFISNVSEEERERLLRFRRVRDEQHKRRSSTKEYSVRLVDDRDTGVVTRWLEEKRVYMSSFYLDYGKKVGSKLDIVIHTDIDQLDEFLSSFLKNAKVTFTLFDSSRNIIDNNVDMSEIELTEEHANLLSARAAKSGLYRTNLSPDELIALEKFYEKKDKDKIKAPQPTGELAEKLEQKLSEINEDSSLYKNIKKALETRDIHEQLIDLVERTKKEGTCLLLLQPTDWFRWFSSSVNKTELQNCVPLIREGDRVVRGRLTVDLIVGYLIERMTAIKVLKRAMIHRYGEEELKRWRDSPRKFYAPVDSDGKEIGEGGYWNTPVSITKVNKSVKVKPGSVVEVYIDVHAWPKKTIKTPTQREVNLAIMTYFLAK